MRVLLFLSRNRPPRALLLRQMAGDAHQLVQEGEQPEASGAERLLGPVESSTLQQTVEQLRRGLGVKLDLGNGAADGAVVVVLGGEARLLRVQGHGVKRGAKVVTQSVEEVALLARFLARSLQVDGKLTGAAQFGVDDLQVLCPPGVAPGLVRQADQEEVIEPPRGPEHLDGDESSDVTPRKFSPTGRTSLGEAAGSP